MLNVRTEVKFLIYLIRQCPIFVLTMKKEREKTPSPLNSIPKEKQSNGVHTMLESSIIPSVCVSCHLKTEKLSEG